MHPLTSSNFAWRCRWIDDALALQRCGQYAYDAAHVAIRFFFFGALMFPVAGRGYRSRNGGGGDSTTGCCSAKFR